MSLGSGFTPLAGGGSKVRANSLVDDFDDGNLQSSSYDDSNFVQAFDEMLSSPPKGPSANRSSLSSGKRSSSKDSRSNTFVSSHMSSDFLLSSSDNFSSPSKSPNKLPMTSSSRPTTNNRTSGGRSTFYTGLDNDADENSYSGSFSVFSDSMGDTINKPTTTPDIGLKKGKQAVPSPVAGLSRGGSNDSDFDLEDSVLGNLIGENPRTRRSMGARPVSASAASYRHPSPEPNTELEARRPHNSFDETHPGDGRPATTGSVGARGGKEIDLDALSGIFGKKDLFGNEYSYPDNKHASANTPAAASSSKHVPANTPVNANQSPRQYQSDDEAYQVPNVSAAPGNMSRNNSGRNSPSLGLFEPAPSYDNHMSHAGASTPLAGIAAAPAPAIASILSSAPTVIASNPLLVTPSNNPPAKKDGDDVDIGFIPSFLDPDRKSRSRRGGPLSRSLNNATPNKGSMEELDRALGLDNAFNTNNKLPRASTVQTEPKIATRLLSSPASNSTPASTSATPNIIDNDSNRIIPSSISSSTAAIASLSGGIAAKLSSSSMQRPHTASTGIEETNLPAAISPTKESSSSRAFDFSNISTRRPQGPQSSPSATSPRHTRISAPPVSPNDDRLTYPSKYQQSTPQLSPQAVTQPKAVTNNSSSIITNTSSLPSSLHLPSINSNPGTSPTASSHISPTNAQHNASYNPYPSMKPMSSPTQMKKDPNNLHTSHQDDKRNITIPPVPPYSPGAIRDLVHQLDEVRLEREASEKRHHQELDALRDKLFQQQQQMLSQATSKMEYVSYASRRENHDSDNLLRNERDDLLSQVRRLEQEVARLRDDAIIREDRHHDEIAYVDAKHEAETRDQQRRYDDEIKQNEQRHQYAIEALKQLHHDELQAIKDRSRDKSSLEQLLGQLSSTSGSIRLIEEQLASKYHGMEAVKEGQLEARERLVKELEDQARYRMESAEMEGYKVKGLIIHLEHMASSMQQQLAEDKIRLRQENERCVALQTSLEQERKLHHERSSSELTILKAKLREAELEIEKVNQAKISHEDKMNADEARFAQDRKEIKQLAQEQAHLAMITSKKLKDDEERLSKLRHDINIEMKDLDHRRMQIRKDLDQAEQIKQQVLQQQQQLQHDQQQHQYEVSRYKSSTSEHDHIIKRTEMQSKQLEQREAVLQRGMDDMRDAAHKLAKKQQELGDLQQLLQQQQTRQSQKEEELSHRKLIKYSSDRQLLNHEAHVSSHAHLNINSDRDENNHVNQPMRYSPSSVTIDREEISSPIPSVDDGWAYAFRSKLMMSDGAKVLANASSIDRSNHDLQQAKKTLQQSKYHLHQDQGYATIGHVVDMDYQLQKEGDFLTSLRQSRVQYR